MSVRGKGPLVCCSSCGRDTRNKTGICNRCYSGVYANEEAKGRKCRQVTEAKSPFDEAQDKYDQTAAEEYHGESIRDDL